MIDRMRAYAESLEDTTSGRYERFDTALTIMAALLEEFDAEHRIETREYSPLSVGDLLDAFVEIDESRKASEGDR